MGQTQLAERIAMIRARFGVKSQGAFSEILGTGKNRVQDLERGKVKEMKKTELEILREKFGINPMWVLYGEGAMIAGEVVGDVAALQKADAVTAPVEALRNKAQQEAHVEPAVTPPKEIQHKKPAHKEERGDKGMTAREEVEDGTCVIAGVSSNMPTFKIDARLVSSYCYGSEELVYIKNDNKIFVVQKGGVLTDGRCLLYFTDDGFFAIRNITFMPGKMLHIETSCGKAETISANSVEIIGKIAFEIG